MTARSLKRWLARTLAVTVLSGGAALAVSSLAALLAAGRDAIGAGVLFALGRTLSFAAALGLATLVVLLTLLQLQPSATTVDQDNARP